MLIFELWRQYRHILKVLQLIQAEKRLRKMRIQKKWQIHNEHVQFNMTAKPQHRNHLLQLLCVVRFHVKRHWTISFGDNCCWNWNCWVIYPQPLSLWHLDFCWHCFTLVPMCYDWYKIRRNHHHHQSLNENDRVLKPFRLGDLILCNLKT